MISTHTLTWSVTTSSEMFSYFANISTHTLTWSVTCKSESYQYLQSNFNSHAHVERDE